MANFIPRLVFGNTQAAEVVFDTPPEGDPQGETISTEKEQVRSVGGQLFTAEFYNFRTFSLRFILQSNAVAIKLKTLLENLALKGDSFLYYPHSDDNSISYAVELESESVTFNRDHPDGRGGFLWSFEFTIINVNKLAPRIVRRDPGPVGTTGQAPGAIQNLEYTTLTDTEVSLAWNPPVNTGSSPIQNYEVRLGTTGSISEASIGGTHEITGLSQATNYTVYVRAVNTEGLKSEWTSLDFTTASTPNEVSAVRNLRATETLHNSVTLAWDVPADTGGADIFTYNVEITSPSSRVISTASNIKDTRTQEITGLNASTQYTFRVRATNVDAVVGPWTTITITTTAAPTPLNPPTNIDLRLKLEDGSPTRRLQVEFDWPTGANSNNINAFDISTIRQGQSISNAQTRRQDVTGVTQRTDLVYDTDTQVDEYRSSAQTWQVRVRGINPAGNGPWSAWVTLSVPPRYRRDFHGNNLGAAGNFVFTRRFGRFSPPASLNIDLSSSANWEGGGTYPRYAFANGSYDPLGMPGFALSETESDELAIIAQVTRRESTVRDKRILLLKAASTSPVTFTPKRFIQENGFVNSITALTDTVNNIKYTRYIYLKSASRYVRMTRRGFPNDVDFPFSMTHRSIEQHYSNGGCCVFDNHLYVLDGGNIYVYNLSTGLRVTSKEIFPGLQFANRVSGLWTNGIYLWFIAEQGLGVESQIRVHCFNITTKARVMNREFNITLASAASLRGEYYGGLVIRQNKFEISSGSFGVSSVPNKMSAYSL